MVFYKLNFNGSKTQNGKNGPDYGTIPKIAFQAFSSIVGPATSVGPTASLKSVR